MVPRVDGKRLREKRDRAIEVAGVDGQYAQAVARPRIARGEARRRVVGGGRFAAKKLRAFNVPLA